MNTDIRQIIKTNKIKIFNQLRTSIIVTQYIHTTNILDLTINVISRLNSKNNMFLYTIKHKL